MEGLNAFIETLVGLTGPKPKQQKKLSADGYYFISKHQERNNMNPKVDSYFDRAGQWQAEYKKLRQIVLDCGLTEEFKWMHPCYTFQESNIVLIHGFKEYCALLFIKGALLKDPKGILIQQTENVQAGRQVRFTNLQEIVKLQPVLKA